jgi:hypothetical protein
MPSTFTWLEAEDVASKTLLLALPLLGFHEGEALGF